MHAYKYVLTWLFIMQVSISLFRVLLFLARPRTNVLGNVPNSVSYRSKDHYSNAEFIPGILIIQPAAPIYFSNANYLRERFLQHMNILGNQLEYFEETYRKIMTC